MGELPQGEGVENKKATQICVAPFDYVGKSCGMLVLNLTVQGLAIKIRA